MTKVCAVSKKSPLVGNNVSHANNKTKRRFLPNLQVASFYSNALDRNYRFKISANAIKTIDFKGGLDAWLLQAKNSTLNISFKKLKQEIQSKVSKS